MNKTTIFAVIGALFAAVLVAVMIQARLSDNDRTTIIEEATVEILVAQQAIPIGQEISKTNIRWQVWPERALFKNAIIKGKGNKTEEDIMGSRVRRTLSKDEPITPNALVGELTGSYMAAALNNGMRAVGIKVKPESSVGGFIQPGDYVDVIMVYNVKIRSDADQQTQQLIVKNAAETVISNIRVLAVDQDADATDRDAKVSKTITVEVDKRGAEIIALSKEMGDIYLSLRQLGDQDTPEELVEFNPVTDSRVGRILDKALDIRDEALGGSNAVRIYNGQNIVNIPVRATENGNKGK